MRKCLEENSLQYLNPAIAEEWNYEKNGVLLPSQIAAHSEMKVWWKCKKCGQEWQAVIFQRSNGVGCPFCANLRPTPGKNDLQTANPALVEEWDYEKNGNLLPSQVSAKSNKKVWWKCKKAGHSWLASICHRNCGEKSTNCPYCSGYLPVVGKTDLQTVNPALAAEWNYEKNEGLLPTEVTAHTRKEVWWKCKKCGQEWKKRIVYRQLGSRCPYCSGQLAIPGKTDLATLHPDIASMWHPTRNGDLQPSQFTEHSYNNVWWHCCKCNQDWFAPISRLARGHRCPYCSGRVPIVGKNDLATLRPDLAAEWHPTKNKELLPSQVTAHSGRTVWWKCKFEHEWKAKIYNRSYGTECPYCKRMLPILGETDLQTVNPVLAAEWHPTKNNGLLPTDVTAQSNKKVWWLGSCGHEWKDVIQRRTLGYLCPICNEDYKRKGIIARQKYI